MHLSRENSTPSEINSRREFLKKALVASAASLTLPSQSIFASAPAPRDAPKDYQIGTCDWTLKSELTTDSFHTARNIGVTGLQYSFSLNGLGLDLRRKENRDTIRQTVKETGVSLSSLGMAILNKVPYAKAQESQKIVLDCIQTMATMKAEADQLEDRELAAKVAPSIALMGFFGKADLNGHRDLMNIVVEKLKVAAPLAEKHGIVLGIESLLNEADHRYILDAVDSPSVKVYYDTANSNKMGYNIYEEMESLGSENICQIHLKENNFLIGEGPIDFDRVNTILRNIGYKDWLIIEGSKGTKKQKLSIEEAYIHNAAYVKSVFNGQD